MSRRAPRPASNSIPGDARRLLSALARAALDACVHGDPTPAPPDASGVLITRCASFVTLRHRVSGELRGCRGEVVARLPLIQSVMRMAAAAALDDPRFPPVTSTEPARLRIEISVLSPLRPIAVDDIQVGQHGLLLTLGGRRGLLLPSVATALGWDVGQLLDGLCHKAGLPSGAWRRPGAQLEGFTTETWEEEDDP